MTVEKTIDRYLSDHGISKVYLSEKSGVPYAAITSSLGGRRKRALRADELIAICEVLGLDIKDLI